MAWHDITCNTHVAWSEQSGGTVKSHDTNMGEWCQWYENQCTYKSEFLITVFKTFTCYQVNLSYCNPVRNQKPQTKNLCPITRLCGDNFISKLKHTIPSPLVLWQSDNAASSISKVSNLKETAEGKIEPKRIQKHLQTSIESSYIWKLKLNAKRFPRT